MDTAEKRRSAAGVPFLPVGPGVTPNAAKPAAWRQQSAWSYSGVLVTEVVLAVGTASMTAIAVSPTMAAEAL